MAFAARRLAGSCGLGQDFDDAAFMTLEFAAQTRVLQAQVSVALLLVLQLLFKTAPGTAVGQLRFQLGVALCQILGRLELLGEPLRAILLGLGHRRPCLVLRLGSLGLAGDGGGWGICPGDLGLNNDSSSGH